ncbi:MAG: polysaccharide deacetylase family protein, partial [Hominimerdicola sp.]
MFISIKLKKSRLFAVLSAAVVLLFSAFKITGNALEENEGIFVPIIMYHSILNDEKQWGDYVISSLQLEKDIIYLKQEGYTPVFVNDLIRYV